MEEPAPLLTSIAHTAVGPWRFKTEGAMPEICQPHCTRSILCRGYAVARHISYPISLLIRPSRISKMWTRRISTGVPGDRGR